MTNFPDLDEAFWLQEPALRLQEEAEAPRIFALEERTARFGEAVIDFAKLIPRGPLTDRSISQVVGCGTSVGGNYGEADDAVSRKEFFGERAFAGRNRVRPNNACAWWCGRSLISKKTPGRSGWKRRTGEPKSRNPND